MAHRFKRPAHISAKDRREERLVKVMATQVANQEMLDKLLDGTSPLMRKALLERLLPYLPFAPEVPTPDCPHCGFRRGSVIAHECQD